MAGSMNRRNGANPVIYPATLAGKLCLSCQLGQRKKIHTKSKFLSENP